MTPSLLASCRFSNAGNIFALYELLARIGMSGWQIKLVSLAGIRPEAHLTRESCGNAGNIFLSLSNEVCTFLPLLEGCLTSFGHD